VTESSISGHPEGSIVPEQIQAAREGSPSALGSLLELCRPYLQQVAKEAIPSELEAKASASDLVQQSFLEAHQGFAQFQGGSEAELLAWLRQILLHNLANFIRTYKGTEMRQVGREEGLHLATGDWLGPEISSASPSEKVVEQENLERMRQALERLPEDYRQVIQWHHQERLNFEEIGERMGRSAEAVRKLWARGLEQLRGELGSSHES